MRMKGYYTVEAAFIVTICLWIFVALCFGGLYIHDKVLVEVLTNEITADTLAKEGYLEKNLEEKLSQELGKRLFLMKISKVSATRAITTVEVTTAYTLPISFTLLKRILSNDGLAYTTTREFVQPANYKWDYDILVGQ